MSILLIERDGPVATLTLNRPETKNALTPELVARLHEAIPSLASDEAIRAVVVRGAGGAFCSGADLKVGVSGDVGEGLDAMHDVIRGIASAPKPFIAAVDGAAVGFGCDIALACDLRVLSTRGYLQEIFVK